MAEHEKGGDEAKDKLKVFVSYSRSDIGFADQLVLALEDRGFDPLIDRDEVKPSEIWEDRHSALIFSCDSVVFVLSKHSAGSAVCQWELDEAERLNKRIIPVLPEAFDGDPPLQLAKLNYIHFYRTEAIPGSGFYRGVQELEQALKTDLDWLREATRVAEQAAWWRARGESAGLLWRGEVPTEAHEWLARTPPGQKVDEMVHAFLNASQAAEDRRKREAATDAKQRKEAPTEAKPRAAAGRARRAGRSSATLPGAAPRPFRRWAMAAALVLVPLAGGLATQGFVSGASREVPPDTLARAFEGELVLASAETADGARVLFTEQQLVVLPPETATSPDATPDAIDIEMLSRPFLVPMPDGSVLAVWETKDRFYNVERIVGASHPFQLQRFRLISASEQTRQASTATAISSAGGEDILLGNLNGEIFLLSLSLFDGDPSTTVNVMREQPDTALSGRVREILTSGDGFTAIGERGDRLVGRFSEGAIVEVDRLPPEPGLALVSRPPKRELSPGSVLRDCDDCPEMVVVPAGSFTMGSPEDEEGRFEDEGPQRTVRIGEAFAVGRYEVTWAEWEACVADGGCSNSGPDSAGGDEGWGKGSRPVINVSWEDAQAYAQWLSVATGEDYRLLSEAEWEYVARAATSTRFSWGDGDPTCSRGASNGANFSSCSSDRTEPVGFSAANAFGVHDLHGNVWEWVEDCYVGGYSGAPTDGSAQEAGDCSLRVLRGGSWLNYPQYLRSAYRGWSNPSGRYIDIGFRVARTL